MILKEDYINYHELIRNLLSSLRDVDVTIKELSWVIKNNYCTEEGKRNIVKRIKNLKDTQFKIAFSLQDLKHNYKNDKDFIQKVLGGDDLINRLRR
jgi:uncharacterized protein YktB (UPF0637 family)